MKSINLFRALLIVSLTTLAIGSVAAQQPQFTVGERVEYKDKSYPTEVWKEGTITKVMPEYHQVVVRWDPREDYPSYTHDGVSTYEQGYSMNDVRPIMPSDGTAAANPPNQTDGSQPKPDAGDANNTTDSGLMSKQEIVDYMKTNGYVNGEPKHDVQVCKDLIELMKKRGVREAVNAGTDDANVINANGCAGHWSTDVVEASVRNQGPPATINWLAATWILTVFGDTVYSAPGDGYVYKQGPKTGTQGSLTISANGSYTWNDGKGQVLKGTWRNATAEEMQTQGGTGIVLLHAAQGRDWLAYK
jgi:hypothetical protein